ncbi:MAG: triose-phosphate isomerase [Chloroflexota bacterium]|nr:MAG: triose-phosphate isomerase [Chloroflexota bacterium]
MNRKPLVAGNWKMNMTVADARHLVSQMVPGLQSKSGVDKVICPPHTALLAVSSLLEGTDISLGAQNLFWEPSGAFTGEISPAMVAEFCDYVILGHSERRAYFGETDKDVNRKVQAAFAHDLTPIVCIGETLEEYEADRTYDVVFRQAKLGLDGIQFAGQESDGSNLVIAYEPIWCIGTGRAATPTDANEVIANVIRPALGELFGNEIAQRIRVLYGGSVTGDNARDFFQQPEIDGALVGGASLKVADYTQITLAAVQ